jgi:GlpG protein
VIELATLASPRAAQAFVDYLSTQGLTCYLRAAGENGVTLLVEQDQAAQVQAEFERFIAEPNHPRYLAASWERTDDAGARFDYGAPGIGLMRNFLLHSGPVSLIVLSLSVLVFALSNLGLFAEVKHWLMFFSSVTDIFSWQQWRWLTPAFIHYSFLHLSMNALWWWYLGGQLEHKEGGKPLLTLFFLTAAIPNLCQFLLSGPHFGGLSGVVYGLFGYFWVRGKLAPQLGLNLTPGLTAFMLIWLAFGFLELFGPPMANMAHFGGLLVGAGYAASRSTSRGTKGERT